MYDTPYLREMLEARAALNPRTISSTLLQLNNIENDPFVPTQSTLDIDWNSPEELTDVPISHLWSMMVEKIAGGNVDYADKKLSELTKEQNDLSRIATYKLNLDRADVIAQRIANGEDDSENTLQQELTDLYSKILEDEDYFMTEGRQSDVVLDLLYDKSKLGNSLKAIATRAAIRMNPKQTAQDITNSTGLSKLGKVMMLPLDAINEVFLSPITYAIDRLPLVGSRKKGDWRRSILKGINETHDEEFRDLIRQSFNGRLMALSLNKDILTKKDQELTDEFEEWKHRRNIDQEWKETGLWHPLYWGTKGIDSFGFRISAPENITDEDRLIQEQKDSFWKPSMWKYAMPELGSSIGMMHYSLGSIATDAALAATGGYLEKNLPVWLGSKLIKPTLGAVSLGVAAENVGKSRDMETSMEAIQAQQDRILELSRQNGADFQQVSSVIRQALQEIDPDRDFSNMTPEDYVRAAISFNIKTGDRAFDNAVKQSQKGLNQLINTNNALRVADYLELMPFMNFGGSVISGLGSKIYHGVGDDLVRYGAKKFTSKTAAEIEKMAAPLIRAAFGKIIDTGAAKFMKSGDSTWRTFAAIKGSRMLKSAGSHVAKLTGVGVSEGFEEGVQELLQARYARGEYDNYRDDVQRFSVPEMFNSIGLAKQALLDYFGLDPNDPENGSFRIKKAMNVGAIAGIMMSNAYAAAPKGARAIIDTAKGNPFDQTKTDWAFADMIANDFLVNQDNRHLQVYYDMLHHGRKGSSIQESLKSFKDIAAADDNLVDPEDVARDARLANVMSFLYKDNKFNKAVEKSLFDKDDLSKGKPGTEEHREALVQAAKTFIDVEDAANLATENNLKYLTKLDNRRQIIQLLLQQNLSNERRKELEEANPRLVKLILQYSLQYLEEKGRLYEKESQKIRKDAKSFIEDEFVRQEFKKNNQDLTEDQITSELKKIYTASLYRNNTQIESLTNAAATKRVDANSLAKESFIEQLLDLLEKWHVSMRLKALELLFDDQAELNKFVRKVTGTDIDANRTLGLKDAITRLRERLGKIHPSVLSIFEGLGSDETMFDDLSELDDLIKNSALNTAVASTLNRILDVYKQNISGQSASMSTTALSEAIFGKNGSVDDELDVIQKAFESTEKWLEENEENPPTGVTSKEHSERVLDKKLKLRKNLEDTFDWLVRRSAKLPEQRKYVAHKSFQDDLEQPIDQTEQSSSIPESNEPVLVSPENNVRQSQMSDNEQSPLLEMPETPNPDAGQPATTEQQLTESLPTEASTTEGGELTLTTPELDNEPLLEPGFVEDVLPENEPFQNESSVDRIIEDEDPDVAQPEDGYTDNIDESVDTSYQIEDSVNSNVDESQSEPQPEDVSEYQPEDAPEYQPEDVPEYLPEDIPERQPEDMYDYDWTKVSIKNEGNVYRIFYDGVEITDENVKRKILSELRLLSASDQSGIFDSIADGGSGNVISPRNQGTVVSETFFFNPDLQLDEEDNEVIVPPTVGDKPILLKYKQASGHLLSKKLSKRGFLTAKTTNVYYVVGRPKRLSSIDDLVKGSDIRDALLIAMVIEDNAEKQCYVTYLKSLGNYSENNDQPAVNEESILRTWIRSKSADWYVIGNGQVPATHSQRISAYNRAYNSLFEEKLKAEYKQMFNIDPDESESAMASYNNWKHNRNLDDRSAIQRLAVFDRISIYTQEALAKKHFRIISNSEINTEIEKLRSFRNQIIEAYLGLVDNDFDLDSIPTEYNDLIKPEEVSQSNGKFNNQKVEEGSIEPKVFSIITGTVEKITEALRTGLLLIGIGRGIFGNPPFGIFGALNKENIFDGKGLSGKLYQMLTGPATKLSAVPAMLLEQKFITQYRTENGKLIAEPIGDPDWIHLCLDSFGRMDPNAGEWLPSAAEAILHLLCNRANGVLTTPEMVEFFLHNGEQTILKDQNIDRSSIMNIFASKQIEYDPNTDVLRIAIRTTNGYELKSYDCRELFLNLDEKRTVVHAIATQMHWNTEKDFLDKTISVDGSDQLSVFIQRLMSAFIDKTKPEYGLRISILNCPLLSFDTSDFLENVNGEVRAKKNVSVLAWLIKEQKIFTDIDPQDQFKDPFVFASGVKTPLVVDNSENVADESKEKKELESKRPPISPKGRDGANVRRTIVSALQDMYDSISASARKALGFDSERNLSKGKWLIVSQEDREKFTTAQNSTPFPLIDRFALTPYKSELGRTAEETFDRIKEYLNSVYDGKLREELLKDLEEQKTQIMSSLDRNSANFNNGKAIVVVEVQRDNKVNVFYMPLSGTQTSLYTVLKDAERGNNAKRFTGVFSSRRAKGSGVSANQAKRWLIDTLGIAEHQVHIYNAVLRSMTNKEVFGVTNLSLNRVMGESTPYIALSTFGEYGIEYHEAFHFVNLLMHNSRERMKLYKSYIKSNPWAINLTYEQIEENIADDFMRYMLGYDPQTSSAIERFFRNTWDFIRFTTFNRNSYKAVFNKIRKGGYAKTDLDANSVKQFAEKYTSGVYFNKFHIKNATNEQLSDNLPNIENAFDFYAASNAIVNSILTNYDFKTLESVANIKMSMLDIYDIIDRLMRRCQNSVLRAQLKDLSDPINSSIILDVLYLRLDDIGIKMTDRQKSSTDASEREKTNDNSYDRFLFEFSKKDNASNAVKLLLATIPQQSKLPDGQYIDDLDDYGSVKLWDQGEVYRKLLKTAWACTSFDKTNGSEYDAYSLMGIITTHAKVDRMFYTLLTILDSIDDSNIKSQLYGTVNSSLQLILFLQIKNPEVKREYIDPNEDISVDPEQLAINTETVLADRERQWSFLGDRELRVARRLPRMWSSSLLMNGLTETGQTEISKQYITQLLNLFYGNRQLGIVGFYAQANNLYAAQKDPKTSKDLIELLFDDTKKALTEVLLKLAIPVDYAVINAFILAKAGINNTSFDKKVEAIYKLATEKTIGSIKEVVDTIISNNKNVIKNSINSSVSKNVSYQLNELLSRRPESSDIGLLANSYDTIHPASEDLTVIDANNNRLYPVSQNNHHTAKIRSLNTRGKAYIDLLRQYPYCAHSRLLDAADKVDPTDPSSYIKLSLFVGLKDGDNKSGGDYFGITALEDVICKMFMTERSVLGMGDDQLVDPTMADKKSYFTVSSPFLKLFHDTYKLGIPTEAESAAIVAAYVDMHPEKQTLPENLLKKEAMSRLNELEEFSKLGTLVNEDDISEYQAFAEADAFLALGFEDRMFSIDGFGNVNFSLSADVIKLFSLYVLDEINALIQYYSKENIEYIINHPEASVDNYYGSVKNGRLLFDGNAGLMRYCYDVFKYTLKDPNNPEKEVEVNLNQYLQALFELQKKIEAGEIENTRPGGEKYVGVNNFEDFSNLDGFELIREELKRIKDTYFSEVISVNHQLSEKINNWLIELINQQLKDFTDPQKQTLLGVYNSRSNMYIPTNIPNLLLITYLKNLQEYDAYNLENAYSALNGDYAKMLAFISLITNFTLNQMVSIIEIEKVVTGDPAFYQYKDRSSIEVPMTYSGKISSGHTTVTVDVIKNFFEDKIKRLGSALSPGEEIRIFYNPDEIEKDPSLGTPLYTVLDLEDVHIKSSFFDLTKDNMRIQKIVDLIRHNVGENIQEYIREYGEKNKLQNQAAIESICLKLYTDDDIRNHIYENILSQQQRDNIENVINRQTDPYSDINVTDALVVISPQAYRRIRIGLGQWTGLCALDETPEEGTDEWAYRIIEENDNWLDDPRLTKAMKKFEIYPLKMVYMQNERVDIGPYSAVLPVLNKMAMFALFKFHRSTPVGRRLYDRMNNDELGRIDMLTFKSAVKVGAKKNAFDPVLNSTDALADINSDLEKPSSVYIDYINKKEVPTSYESPLAVRVQSLDNLRMLLNTESHHDEERNIGTQILKIAFSNILPYAEYTSYNGEKVSGSELIKQIMSFVNGLTKIGKEQIESQFKENSTINQKSVIEFLRTVVRNNNLGFYADEILEEDGSIQSLSSSTVFEQSVISKINKAAVDIPTNGGSAIQQSEFGFVGSYQNGSSIATDDQYVSYNDGNPLKWIKEDNSMEVMLSIKFFDSVVPWMYRSTYTTMRQWLIDHDKINGKKSNRKYYGEDDIFDRSVDDFIVYYSDDLYTAIKTNEKIATIGDLYVAYKHDKFSKYSGELKTLFEKTNIEKYQITEERSNPTPFGLGYRIPTQGMSSAFVFCVADVLPRHVGDLIIVPAEFTAQTGSDFDVDKIYIATLAHKNGNVVKYDKDNPTKAGLSNALLLTYINIITDQKNFSLARGSVDVMTSRIKNDLVKKILRSHGSDYAAGGILLTPSFLAMRKSEFMTGKNGISVFALSIPSVAMTQATGMTLAYGKNEYLLGNLYEIYGDDDLYITDWLSAMVNAHVDVAKDSYVFDINVNKFTWNHTAFLIRCGKGMGTFTFLAQPILKDYANIMNNIRNIYGGNIDDVDNNDARFKSQKTVEYHHMLNKYKMYLNELLSNPNIKISKEDLEYLNFWNEYANFITMSKKGRDLLHLKYSQWKKKVLEYKATAYKHVDPERTGLGSMADVFNETFGRHYLNIMKTKFRLVNGHIIYSSEDVLDLAKALVWQLRVIIAFLDVVEYANHLAELVHLSLIDTKKYGNTIMLIYNFIHSINTYISTDDMWITNRQIEDSPLEGYFGDTWLMDKIKTVYDLSTDILSQQSFSATPIYRDVFVKIAQTMFGVNNVDANKFTPEYTGYMPIKKQDDVNLITNLLNSVLQFNTMFYNNQLNLMLQYGVSADAIDLSFGGNINFLVENISRILFGDGRLKNLFQRTNDLLKEIENSDDIIYDDLKENGVITNSFIKFIFAMPPSMKNPIGEIVLGGQLSRLPETKRILLASDVEVLLYHDSQKIREWMRDIVTYSYYANNNKNTYNAFFELIPITYRQMFDMSVKDAILAMSDDKADLDFLGIRRVSDGIDISDIFDVICRNNWFNDRLVPVKARSSEKSYLDLSGGNIYKDVYFATFYNIADKANYHRAIMLNKNKNSILPLYIKGPAGQLYHKSGILTITKQGPDNDILIIKYVYLPTEKAGLGSKFLEMWAKFGVASMFEKNELREELREDETKDFVENSLLNIVIPDGVTIDLRWDIDPMLISHVNAPAKKQQNTGSNVITLRRVDVRGSSETYAKDHADVIVNITTEDKSLEDVEKNKQFLKKTLILNVTNPADFDQLLSEMLEGSTLPIIHITTNLYDSEIIKALATNEEAINKQLDKLYQQYLSRHKKLITKDQFKALKDGMWVNIARKNVAMLKLYNILVKALSSNNVFPGGYSASVYTGHSIVVKMVSVINNIIATLLGDSLPGSALFINRNFLKSLEFLKLAKKLNTDIKSITDTVVGNEEADLVEEQNRLEELAQSSSVKQPENNNSLEGSNDQPLIISKSDKKNSNEHENC